MTMTRQHFEAIAAILASEVELTARARLRIAKRFAEVCASTNANFDRARFLKACGVAEKVGA